MIVAVNTRTGARHHFADTHAFSAWLSLAPHDASVLNVSEVKIAGRPEPSGLRSHESPPAATSWRPA